MIISDSHKFIWFFPAKTGSTTLLNLYKYSRIWWKKQPFEYNPKLKRFIDVRHVCLEEMFKLFPGINLNNV